MNPITKFKQWLKTEKGRGLVDFKVFRSDNAPLSEEEACDELNRALEAKSEEDPDLI